MALEGSRKVSLNRKMKKGRRLSPQYMSENGGKRFCRNPDDRNSGNFTGYITQEEGLNVLTDFEPTSANATLENTMGFRSTGKIPTKGSHSMKKAGGRTKSVTNMQRYGNES